MPFSGALPDPGIKHALLISFALASRFFTSSATWEAPLYPYCPPKACLNLFITMQEGYHVCCRTSFPRSTGNVDKTN